MVGSRDANTSHWTQPKFAMDVQQNTKKYGWTNYKTNAAFETKGYNNPEKNLGQVYGLV